MTSEPVHSARLPEVRVGVDSAVLRPLHAHHHRGEAVLAGELVPPGRQSLQHSLCRQCVQIVCVDIYYRSTSPLTAMLLYCMYCMYCTVHNIPEMYSSGRDIKMLFRCHLMHAFIYNAALFTRWISTALCIWNALCLSTRRQKPQHSHYSLGAPPLSSPPPAARQGPPGSRWRSRCSAAVFRYSVYNVISTISTLTWSPHATFSPNASICSSFSLGNMV